MILTFWNKLKQLFTGKSLSAQFEEILLKDEAHSAQVVDVETVKEEPVAKKKTVAKPTVKVDKAPKPAAKGKKK